MGQLLTQSSVDLPNFGSGYDVFSSKAKCWIVFCTHSSRGLQKKQSVGERSYGQKYVYNKDSLF